MAPPEFLTAVNFQADPKFVFSHSSQYNITSDGGTGTSRLWHPKAATDSFVLVAVWEVWMLLYKLLMLLGLYTGS